MKLRDFSEFQKVMEMMNDYMSLVISLGAKVCGITYDSRKYYEFEFVIEESGTIYSLFVKNWEIYNINGNKCIDIMRDAYDTFPDMISKIEKFEKKWKIYKK